MPPTKDEETIVLDENKHLLSSIKLTAIELGANCRDGVVITQNLKTKHPNSEQEEMKSYHSKHECTRTDIEEESISGQTMLHRVRPLGEQPKSEIQNERAHPSHADVTHIPWNRTGIALQRPGRPAGTFERAVIVNGHTPIENSGGGLANFAKIPAQSQSNVTVHNTTSDLSQTQSERNFIPSDS